MLKFLAVLTQLFPWQRAEADDYAEANRLLQSLSQPFGDAATDDAEESVTYTKPPATEDLSLCVT